VSALSVSFEEPVRYAEGVRIQEALLEARTRDAIPDVVLWLEHAPVITFGNRARREHLLATESDLRARGIDLEHASRGGDITYHGPGQLVVYPILRLGDREADAHGYLWNLEEIAVRTAADFGVRAWRKDGKNGAWTESGKIAAIGFRLKRWVTLHGMSFNVNPDLDGFSAIVPCGLAGQPVASLRSILGDAAPSLAKVREAMAGHFEDVMGRTLAHHDAGNLPKALKRFF
jgi:lipoic acid synthetase/lipoyl(octanoyl) transferase